MDVNDFFFASIQSQNAKKKKNLSNINDYNEKCPGKDTHIHVSGEFQCNTPLTTDPEGFYTQI